MIVPDKKRKDEVERILYPEGIRWLVAPTFDEDGVQRSAGIDQYGSEHGDPVPMSPPIGLAVERRDTLHDALRTMFLREREQWRAAIEREEFESEDEANDFLVPEDLFPPGNEPWEDVFDALSGEEGKSPTLAGEAPNGQATPQNVASQPSTSSDRRVSEGSVSGSLKEPLERKSSGVFDGKSKEGEVLEPDRDERSR